MCVCVGGGGVELLPAPSVDKTVACVRMCV